jgi:DNA-binding LytR/AlgR family response regulator
MALKSILVDDDVIARRILESYILENPELELVAQCERPTEAIHLLNSREIDVIFLDIEMPEMSGLDLIRTLQNPPKIILISGNEKYAAEAFDLDVIDYLVKPVGLPRFLKSVQRLQRVARPSASPGNETTVFVKVDSRLVKLDLNAIQWIKAQGDYVTIHTSSQKLFAHSTLKGMAAKLHDPPFVRVHRSYIVHLDHIDDIEEATLVIGSSVIPIGASYRKNFLSRLHLL